MNEMCAVCGKLVETTRPYFDDLMLDPDLQRWACQECYDDAFNEWAEGMSELYREYFRALQDVRFHAAGI